MDYCGFRWDMSHYRQFEPPFPIPDFWQWATVGEVSSSILYGVSESAKLNGKYKLLRITDIQDNNVLWDNVPFTNFDTNKVKQYILQDGDILFARTGATVGKSYLVKEVPQNSIYASYLIRIRTSNEICPKYLKLFFESGYYWQQISEGSVGIGQPNVNGTSLGQLLLPVPPKAEQIRIINRAESLSELISSIDAWTVNLSSSIEQTKNKILDLAMQGMIVPQDPSDEPAADMLRRINPNAKIIADTSHYNAIPKNWVTVGFTDVCNAALGKTLNKGTDIGEMHPYLCAINVKDGYFDLNTIKQTKILPEEFERYSVYKGDLLVCEGGDVGRCAIWQGDRIFYQNALHRIRPLIGIEQKFLRYFLLYAKNKYWIDELCSGVTIKHFTTKAMSNIVIAIPPNNEQRRIIEKIENLFELLDTIEEELMR